MLLIDGYNLLHVTDLFGQGSQAGTLEGSREALLDYLVDRLTQRELQATRIVFDAAGAPPGLPAELTRSGMQVLFARDFPDADAMLEALLEQEQRPRELLVVSGDRRVQRAARQQGASWIDSSAWFVELRRRPLQPHVPETKQAHLRDIGDTDYWVAEFSSESMADLPAMQDSDPRSGAPDAKNTGQDAQNEESLRSSASPLPAQPVEPELPVESPFPPGYADDLAAQLEESSPADPEDPPAAASTGNR